MKSIIGFILFLMVTTNLYSQENEKVKEAMLNYLNGFYTGDSTLFISSIDSNVYKYGYFINNGEYKGTRMSYKEMFAFARDVRQGKIKFPANPKAEVIIFEINDQTASGKVIAEWGIDYILLAKRDKRWMIREILWQTFPKK